MPTVSNEVVGPWTCLTEGLYPTILRVGVHSAAVGTTRHSSVAYRLQYTDSRRRIKDLVKSLISDSF